MRMINANDIPWDMEGVGFIPVVTKEEIDNMPTIEAIPIEWIKQYGEENWFDFGTQFNAITRMLKDWAERKEEWQD